MNESDSYDEGALTAQLEQSRERLDTFELELQAVESELEVRKWQFPASCSERFCEGSTG